MEEGPLAQWAKAFTPSATLFTLAHTHAVCYMSPGLLLYPYAAPCSAHNNNVGQADPADRHRLVHAGEISKG